MLFSILVLRLVDQLPSTASGQVIGRQLAKRATSVGANYRGSCIARSRAEFIAQLGVVLEEADESVYWLDIILRGQLLPESVALPVHIEACELRAIFGKSLGTARANNQIARTNNQTTRTNNQTTR